MLRRLRSSVALLLTLAMLLALGPVRPAVAAEELSETEAVELLREYGIVLGDPDGSLRLNDTLTREQAAAIFVRAYGMSDLAQMMADAVPFPDAQGRWSSGDIAMAYKLGLMRGDPSGMFRPEDRITYAEILTVLLRMVEQEPTGPWDPEGILSKGRALGITPPGVSAGENGVRGRVFWALASTLVNVPLRDAPNLLRKYIDQTPPDLQVDPVVATTTEARLEITGRAIGAHKVTVGGSPATLDRRTGAFSHSISLDLGTNKVTVEAVDRAGNKAVKTLSVERKGVASRITITGPSIVPANSSQRLEVTATDNRGNPVPLEDVEATVTQGLATFDTRTMTLTTTDKTGRGTLTLQAGSARGSYTFQVYGPSEKAASLEVLEINKGHAPAVGKETTVTVRVLDQSGKVLSDDYFRTITLRTSGMSGLTLSNSTAQTEKGVATFTLKASREGTATLTFSSPGLPSVEREVQFLESPRIVLTASPKTLKPDGSSKATIKASLVDENGKSITNNSDRDILVALTATGTDGYFENELIIIPRGKSSSSGGDASFVAGELPGTATIRGEIISNHKYSVQNLSLPVDQGMTGSRFDITFSPSSPKPGDPVKVTVRVLDGSNKLVTTGSYAFQLKLSTSNNDRLINGIPEGVTLTFPGSGYYPVDDGRPASSPDNDPMSVVGRTTKGVAELTLTYGRSGTVTITPVPVGATYEAYNGTEFGGAASSIGFYAPAKEISFAGTASKVILTVDSDLGKDQAGGAVSSAKQLTVRAKVVDAYNNPIPGYREYATLERLANGDGVTRITGANRRLTSDGVAEFTVYASAEEGWDQYQVRVGSLTSAPLTIAVNRRAPLTPEVIAIHGVKSGGLSPVGGYVGPDADYMEITLANQDSLNLDQPTNFVVAKVYRKGESKPFYTSEAIDLANGVPTIRIPRSALKLGTYYYEVVVNNGYADSPRSLALDDYTMATVVDYSGTYKLSSATYDAVTGRLTLSGSRLTSNGKVDAGKIRIVDGPEVLRLDPDVVEVTSISSSSVVILLHGQAAELTPDRFHGPDVYVEADAGWFVNKEGTQFAEPATKVPVKPMATITEAALDLGGKRLYVYGEGFRQGSLNLTAIGITDGGEPVKLTSKDKTAATPTDGQIVVNLSNETVAALKALTGSQLYIVADAGWVYSGSGSNAARVGAIEGTGHPVYSRATVTRAEYDRATGTLRLTGTNLAGAVLDPTKLEFRRNTKDAGWRPSSATPAAVGHPDNDVIEIQFSADDAAKFVAEFGGRVVYMNTAEGWLTDASGRRVLRLPDYSVQFTVPAK
ncbi:hypothetical protein J2Z79_003424 [Symbiobacterium terraclitae]|uniref:SLH domain-containing protein n=1 Tax=Symbiobacterium terraclitae TaxID=557451 RepID=A0ABS4JWS1_9FIRM|nr:S-layer homology domain-containing protein [Symbiobacterium terraclitae]MBP2019977.1 hypothetical protein [Symbiobacterium terraclitae]